MAPTPIDEHLAAFAPAQRKALESVCATIRTALTAATETISYGMPTFKIDGVAVIGLDGFTRHNSLFPYSAEIQRAFEGELAGFVRTKGSIHFDVAVPFPAPLLKRMLRARIAEINASYPRKSGEFKEFYANGQLKAKGRMRDGARVGRWVHFTREGTERPVG